MVTDLISVQRTKRLGFVESVKQNFFLDTLWLSVFVNHPWSFCNRSARITLVTMTVAVAAISNLMFYQAEKGKQVSVGPLRFSPSILFVNIVTSLMTALPSLIFTVIFSNTAPKDLNHISQRSQVLPEILFISPCSIYKSTD